MMWSNDYVPVGYFLPILVGALSLFAKVNGNSGNVVVK